MVPSFQKESDMYELNTDELDQVNGGTDPQPGCQCGGGGGGGKGTGPGTGGGDGLGWLRGIGGAIVGAVEGAASAIGHIL
jgi:hypothetical protein